MVELSEDKGSLCVVFSGLVCSCGVCLVVGRAVALLWRGPRVVPVPRLLFILAASIRLRLRGCGRATLRVFGEGPKVNLSRRGAASIYVSFLGASYFCLPL